MALQSFTIDLRQMKSSKVVKSIKLRYSSLQSGSLGMKFLFHFDIMEMSIICLGEIMLIISVARFRPGIGPGIECNDLMREVMNVWLVFRFLGCKLNLTN